MARLGLARPGIAWQTWQGAAGKVSQPMASFRELWHGRAAMARMVLTQRSSARQASFVVAAQGKARSGRRGSSLMVEVWYRGAGSVPHGAAGQRPGLAWLGLAGMVLLGAVSVGRAGQRRLGAAGCVTAHQGTAGKASLGVVSYGRAGRCR